MPWIGSWASFPEYLDYLGNREYTLDVSAQIAHGTGAVMAALFLEQFIADDIPWVHFDLMAWNLSTQPGHPEGGEAMGVCAVYQYLANCYA